MQERQVRSLILEDPICLEATQPMGHNYWACALDPGNCNYWAYALQLLEPEALEPVLRSRRIHGSEKPVHHSQSAASYAPQAEKSTAIKKKKIPGTSLVVQWLRLHLPMQGSWVQPLVGELRSHMLQVPPKIKKKKSKQYDSSSKN